MQATQTAAVRARCNADYFLKSTRGRYLIALGLKTAVSASQADPGLSCHDVDDMDFLIGSTFHTELGTDGFWKSTWTQRWPAERFLQSSRAHYVIARALEVALGEMPHSRDRADMTFVLSHLTQLAVQRGGGTRKLN